MAIYKTTYGLPGDQEDNPYLIAEDEVNRKKNRWAAAGAALNTGTSNPIVTDTDTQETDVTDQDESITGETGTNTETPETPVVEETGTTETAEGEDPYTKLLKQLEDMTKSGSVTEQYKAAILSAIEAQKLTTQQAIDQLEYEKEKAEKARVKANREADLTFSRAINSTGKINQNIRSAGLAGSGWQETSQVGLFNGYQNALNTNTSDYNTAVKELNLAISQAQQSGDIATMQAIQTYAIQLAQQLYQESRDAVADRQWELSYALQKAAFDLEHAAQTGSTGYYDSGSPYTSGDSRVTNTSRINADDSYKTATDINEQIQNYVKSGLVGDDLRWEAAILIYQYLDKMTDEHAETLMGMYGLTEGEVMDIGVEEFGV